MGTAMIPERTIFLARSRKEIAPAGAGGQCISRSREQRSVSHGPAPKSRICFSRKNLFNLFCVYLLGVLLTDFEASGFFQMAILPRFETPFSSVSMNALTKRKV